MANKYSRRIFAIALGSAGVALGANERCDVCGLRLGRQAWTYDGLKCCSQECVDELRPVCSICKTTLRGEYKTSNGQIYCGEACFLTTLPKCDICQSPIKSGFTITRHKYCGKCAEKQPRCFSCGLPAQHPTRLKDGREICSGCMRWAVKTQDMAERHYARARRQLEAWTSLTLGTVPELVLVDRSKMVELSKDIRKSDSPVSVRGLYSRQTMIRRNLLGSWKEDPALAKETIYIVDHLTDEVFRVAATHELMHDMIHEFFPRLEDAPLWVHEGICQQAAAELCQRRNYGDTLHGIENCKDPDYGGGYRYFNSMTGLQGWHALRRWMETVDVESLPDTVPD